TGTVVRTPATQITLNYDGPITTAGIALTDTANVAIPNVTVTAVPGAGNTVVVTFSGTGVTNGTLPPGSYRLQLRGGAHIANGRATDNNNNGSDDPAGSDGVFDFTQTFVVAGPVVPTTTGFVVTFNAPFDPSTLNLFAGASGAADVVLSGPSGTVSGSLVVN